MEDVWRGEVQDLLSQITQLQTENKKLLVSLSLKESPVTQEDLQKQEGRFPKSRLSSGRFQNDLRLLRLLLSALGISQHFVIGKAVVLD